MHAELNHMSAPCMKVIQGFLEGTYDMDDLRLSFLMRVPDFEKSGKLSRINESVLHSYDLLRDEDLARAAIVKILES